MPAWGESPVPPTPNNGGDCNAELYAGMRELSFFGRTLPSVGPKWLALPVGLAELAIVAGALVFAWRTLRAPSPKEIPTGKSS